MGKGERLNRLGKGSGERIGGKAVSHLLSPRLFPLLHLNLSLFPLPGSP